VDLGLALLLVMMLLASITTFHVSRRWYVPMALVWTLAFLLFGQLAGLSWDEMGLAAWLPGLLWGGAAILLVSVGMAAGVAIPRLHPLFADERVIGTSGLQVAHKSLVEVPLGTVALEEVVFRSVLLGLLTSLYGTAWGVAGSALLFGLWHVLPALEMHDAHSLTSQLGSGWRAKVGTVLGTILATGSAGVLFAMLVVWSGSVLAPMGLHWAMNSTGSIAAWLVSRRAASTSADSPSGDEPPAQEPERASDAGP
jgi:membrane protease YdiL (CAAX protease family)